MTFVYNIRPLTEQDIPKAQELFRTTVLHINCKDYNQAEVEDWASCGDSIAHWHILLSKHDFIAAATGQGDIVGFASMNPDGYLHSMFVHENWQRHGIATRLLLEVEKMAQKYGVAKIYTEVSITARPFFEKHKYRTVKEQKQKANKLFLTNYRMEKVL